MAKKPAKTARKPRAKAKPKSAHRKVARKPVARKPARKAGPRKPVSRNAAGSKRPASKGKTAVKPHAKGSAAKPAVVKPDVKTAAKPLKSAATAQQKIGKDGKGTPPPGANVKQPAAGHKPSAGEIAAKIAGKRAEDAAHKKGKNGRHNDIARPQFRQAAETQQEVVRAVKKELRQSISRPQLVQIVDDEHERFDPLRDFRQDSRDNVVFVGRSGRCRQLLGIDRAGRVADRVQDAAPEPRRMLLVAEDRHERDATNVGRAIDPRTQQ